MRMWVVILGIAIVLSGCRFWSLYQFGEQFCEFDEYVKLSQNKGATHIDFNEPVLPQAVLLRYLNALPFMSSYQALNEGSAALAKSDTFHIQRTMSNKDSSEKETYRIDVKYHPVGKAPLLSSGELDSRLSTLFSPKVVEPILKSFCSDDYDLSLKRLNMRFTLKDIEMGDLPAKQLFLTSFGLPDQVENNTLRYQFDFIQKDFKGDNLLQNKPIAFSFTFNAINVLTKMHILYHKYDYLLDFEKMNGSLLVIRT